MQRTLLWQLTHACWMHSVHCMRDSALGTQLSAIVAIRLGFSWKQGRIKSHLKTGQISVQCKINTLTLIYLMSISKLLKNRQSSYWSCTRSKVFKCSLFQMKTSWQEVDASTLCGIRRIPSTHWSLPSNWSQNSGTWVIWRVAKHHQCSQLRWKETSPPETHSSF